ncbi:restriction endonuclease subunit S [Actinomadura sp. NPDC048955]|uniref:restriction endonuclease subunit S n=1 Tax=Actinomadura sp. NPDC048955 TaxID=3158228 RepID=UPI0034061744
MSSRAMRIPNLARWEVIPLSELCTLISRGSAPTYVDDSPVLAIGQRCVQHSGFDANAARPHDRRHRSRMLGVERGDVLLNSTGTGTIGRSCVFDHGGAFVVDGHVTVLRVDTSKANSTWLDALLRSPWGQQHLESQCFTGSTSQIELSRSQLVATEIPTPSIREQQRIAEILDALDEERRFHDDVMLKNRKLCQAVIGDLMSGRGFEAPTEYVRCSQILSLTGGLPQRQARMSLAGTIPIYGSSGLAGFGDKALSIGETLVIGRVGEGGVGSVRHSPGPCWVTDNALWSTWISPDWSSEFLAMYLDWCDLRKLRSQTGQPLITQSAIGKVPVPVLPLERQEKVVAVACALNDQHGMSNAHLSKSALMRKGIAEDLLTGRVRV